jgi:5-formyltetrahydrofolate cyclo-ligase
LASRLRGTADRLHRLVVSRSLCGFGALARTGFVYEIVLVGVTKQEIREAVWSLLQSEHVARFPGARGRIPNFKGAEACSDKVAELEVWKRARVLKANPDSPQRAIRHLALKHGKTIYMAVPRLREEKCFIELDPARLRKDIYKASSIKGAFELGRHVAVTQMKPVDLILCGSVAVRRDGARIGKGGGYSDLEYAIALEMGIVTAHTPIITTVHPLQIVDAEYALEPHDIPVDFIVTPNEIINCKTKLAKPEGIYWEYLDEEKIAAIPLLKKMKARLDAQRSL